jgi:hypothetical protein
MTMYYTPTGLAEQQTRSEDIRKRLKDRINTTNEVMERTKGVTAKSYLENLKSSPDYTPMLESDSDGLPFITDTKVVKIPPAPEGYSPPTAAQMASDRQWSNDAKAFREGTIGNVPQSDTYQKMLNQDATRYDSYKTEADAMGLDSSSADKWQGVLGQDAARLDDFDSQADAMGLDPLGGKEPGMFDDWTAKDWTTASIGAMQGLAGLGGFLESRKTGKLQREALRENIGAMREDRDLARNRRAGFSSAMQSTFGNGLAASRGTM